MQHIFVEDHVTWYTYICVFLWVPLPVSRLSSFIHKLVVHVHVLISGAPQFVQINLGLGWPSSDQTSRVTLIGSWQPGRRTLRSSRTSSRLFWMRWQEDNRTEAPLTRKDCCGSRGAKRYQCSFRFMVQMPVSGRAGGMINFLYWPLKVFAMSAFVSKRLYICQGSCTICETARVCQVKGKPHCRR